MSGCHKPECLSTCCDKMKERIEKLEEWFKKLYNDIVCPSGGYLWKTQPSNYDNVLCKKLNDIEDMVIKRLEKLEGYMTMEDRVTANDIFFRIKVIEDFIGQNYKVDYSDHDERIDSLEDVQAEMRLLELEKFKQEYDAMPTYDLKTVVDTVNDHADKINQLLKRKAERPISIQPHRCPLCEGAGDFKLNSLEEAAALGIFRQDGLGNRYTQCHACEGKGIVWG